MKDGQNGWQEVFARDRAGTQQEFPGNRELVTSDFVAGRPMEGEDALRVVVAYPFVGDNRES
jgi:hypothetical protein